MRKFRKGDRVYSTIGKMCGTVQRTRYDCGMPYFTVLWDNGHTSRHGFVAGIVLLPKR
jgi:hypothetical protein